MRTEGIIISEKTVSERDRRALGIELGSTRIKAVMMDADRNVIESQSHHWESQFVDGHWTYGLDEVQEGLRDALSQFTESFTQVSTAGLSAMMHGYLVFDKNDQLLVPFRTWKDTTTKVAAEKLTTLFDFNIPERWSIAHLYQAILNNEPHVKDIAYITTLAGYVHLQLTGKKVIGIGDASGMFPVKNNQWHPVFVEQFETLTGIDWPSIAPDILVAGQEAGALTDEGQSYLWEQKRSDLIAPLRFCPPEGDAGTGMVSCNAIAPRTGNVSAGTSIFAMVVLDKPLSKLHRDVDIVTTPDGKDVAMVHYNECTSKIDPWIMLFEEAFAEFGLDTDRQELFRRLYEISIEKDSRLASFMRGVLSSAISDLADGLKILIEEEQVTIDRLSGHGGFFKSGRAGKTIMSELIGIPVDISETAAEGGAWGIALLADYLNESDKMTLSEYLEVK